MKMRFVYLGLMFVISYFRANGYSEVMPTTRISLPKCFLKESKVLQGTPCTKQDPSPCDSCSGGTCSANFLTSDFCHDYCVKKGYEHFGLQYNLCHCGTFDYSKHYKSINDSMCAYKCQGDPDNKPLVVYCGGHGNVWIQPTKVLSTQPVLNTTLQPELSTEVATSSHFNNQLEVLVNQSTTFSESTTVNDLILFSNKLSNLSISSSSTKVIVNIIDDILEIDDKFQEGQNEERAADASRTIIRLLDDQITTTFEDDANFTVTDNNNLALKAVTFDKYSISTDLQFSATEDNQVLLEFSDTYKYSTDTVVSVTIPADVLISTEVAMTQISFVVFHRSGLFFIDEGSANGQDETVVWREVVRVKEEVTNPEKEFNSNLTYNFQNVTMEGECKDFKARCSYTEALSNVLRNGCETNDNGNGQFSCSCNRFGHVALLLDPVRENIGREHTLVLHFLSIGLFSLSAILLIVIMLVYLSNKKIRQRVQYKVLIGLYFSLAAFDVIYIASNYPPKSKELCKAIGVAVHYFLLSSVMWMGGEVFTLYLNVVPKTKFDQNNVMFVKKVASVCFLLPLVPVTFGAVYSFKTECSKIHQCFKLSEVTFYTALVAPVSLILFVNVVLFIRIIHTLYTSGKATSNKSNKLHRLTRHVFTIFILSGLSWCLAFFSLDYDGSIAFNYLFTIFNGLQGIVIFILFLVLNKDVKKILSKSRVGRSIRYGFRSPPPKSKTNSNLQHFKQNQQISEDPSYSIGVSATNMEYM
ncbi:adhesion G-protein coupled receptor G6-like [Antedon mediterranea]|uniref:adhesion G-protein coupled receptor G6-like n=1 Tax=Antedon mediterranea TaxID=105859 RepID=UPI003AF759B2